MHQLILITVFVFVLFFLFMCTLLFVFLHSDDIDLELRLARFEQLIARRPLLLNSVLLRQNPHNVHEWHKRVKLYDGNPRQVGFKYFENGWDSAQVTIYTFHTKKLPSCSELLINSPIFFRSSTHTLRQSRLLIQ